jgi:hypothetical protein
MASNVTISILLMILILPLFGGTESPREQHKYHHMDKTGSTVKDQTETVDLRYIYTHQLPSVMDSVNRAIEALKAKQQDLALQELQKVRQNLIVLQKNLAQHIAPKFLNTKCPIMGTPIDPEKVPPALVRSYKEGKVAFCCAGCPVAWDRLSDHDKDAKLQAVSTPTKDTSHNEVHKEHHH